jgi:hypothetical protein
MDAIAGTVSSYNPPEYSEPADGGRVAYAEFIPAHPLNAGWYVLSLASVPEQVDSSTWSAPVPPIGVHAARFNTESQPLVIQVHICAVEGSTGFRAAVIISEKVVVDAQLGDAVKIEQTSAGRACIAATSGVMAPTQFLDFSCPGFSAEDTWRLTVGSGVVAPGGAPLTGPDGGAPWVWEFEWTSMSQIDDHCRAARP